MAYIDPVKAAPDNYKLLFEDDTHRVLEMSLKAGQKDNEHSHPSEVVFFISGGSARISMPDGHVMAHEAWTHTVENTGDKDIKLLRVITRPTL